MSSKYALPILVSRRVDSEEQTNPPHGNAPTRLLHSTMTPRTRPGNRETGVKVYHAKKIPQQVHFPHKRKTVRRPWSPTREDVDRRQMVFLPEKMKVTHAGSIRDSDEENEATDLEKEAQCKNGDQGIHRAAPAAAKRSTKRGSDTNQHKGSDEQGPVPSTSKRRRTERSVKPERILRRQSTMTQLVDGRRPLSDVDEPEFKPLKRSSRVSWSGKGRSRSKDQQQQTLTQMIPGMRPLEITSDEYLQDALSDLEAQESDSQSYDSAVARRLAVQGEHHDADAAVTMKEETDDGKQSITHLEDDELHLPAVAVQSVETATNDEWEESYRPTQYIDAPSFRPGRLGRRSTKMGSTVDSAGTLVSPHTRAAHKSSFSLLNTPEKRRIREIPSSQSPADSPPSTQVSPQKLYRSPLQEHADNPMPTPSVLSKRKRVVFKDPSAPPNLRRFESTIQDSEDENDVIEDDLPIVDGLQDRTELSPELGDVRTYPMIVQKNISEEQAHGFLREPPNDNVDGSQPSLTFSQYYIHAQELDEVAITTSVEPLPHAVEIFHSTPEPNEMYHQETFPSTPMVIQDDSSNEDADEYTPVSQRMRPINLQPVSVDQQHTADLDGEPIQVPRSPSTPHEIQQCHSSKAEQQLQHEWFSYSQYVHARPPTSSSMHGTHDTSSYGVTQSIQRTIAPPSQSIAHAVSQATTLDEVTQRTPGKNRAQQWASAHTTPSKPPPLFIPSSFPSPAKAAMQGWSSPVHGRTQDMFRSSPFGMSLEDFSIPPPPPPPPPVDEDSTHEHGL